jgi:hypothetical protein
MIPSPFEAGPLSVEPGATGRVLRVTIGIATLFLATYYQTMLLTSVLLSQNQPIDYNLGMLADDIDNGRSTLLLKRVQESALLISIFLTLKYFLPVTGLLINGK